MRPELIVPPPNRTVGQIREIAPFALVMGVSAVSFAAVVYLIAWTISSASVMAPPIERAAVRELANWATHSIDGMSTGPETEFAAYSYVAFPSVCTPLAFLSQGYTRITWDSPAPYATVECGVYAGDRPIVVARSTYPVLSWP